MEPDDDQQPEVATVHREAVQATIALILVILGVVAMTTGATFMWGSGAGFLTAGLNLAVLGYVLGFA